MSEFYGLLPENELLITDVLLQIIRSALPDRCGEKISYNVPYFYGNKGICLVWPASIPRGGVAEGVLLGFWYGSLLKDPEGYLDRGTNKQIYYKIFRSADEIDHDRIIALLAEALEVDKAWKRTILRGK